MNTNLLLVTTKERTPKDGCFHSKIRTGSRAQNSICMYTRQDHAWHRKVHVGKPKGMYTRQDSARECARLSVEFLRRGRSNCRSMPLLNLWDYDAYMYSLTIKIKT